MTYEDYDDEVERAKEILRKASELKEFFVCWIWNFEDPDEEIIKCTHEGNVRNQYYHHIDACNVREAKLKFLSDRFQKEWVAAEHMGWVQELNRQMVSYLVDNISWCEYESEEYITNYEARTKDIYEKYWKKRNAYEENCAIVTEDQFLDDVLDDLDVDAIISEMSEKDVKALFMNSHYYDVIAIAMNKF